MSIARRPAWAIVSAYLGYDLERQPLAPGQSLNLTLYWQALRPVPGSYKVFTHLLDAGGVVRGQRDQLPRDGQYPTDQWLAGEVVVDRYVLPVDGVAPSGSYRLEIGMYDPQLGGERVGLYGADGVRLQDDRLLLDTTLVVP